MISTELANLADYCLGFAAQQKPIPPRTAAVLANALLDLSQQARQLERLPCDDMALDYAGEKDGDGC